MWWRNPRRAAAAYIANRDVLLARLLQNLGEDTFVLELKVHLGLVRLDLHEHLAGRDELAGLLLPRADVARRHCRRQGRHLDDGVRRVRGVPSCKAGDGDAGERGTPKGLPPKGRDEHLEALGKKCETEEVEKKGWEGRGGRWELRREIKRSQAVNTRVGFVLCDASSRRRGGQLGRKEWMERKGERSGDRRTMMAVVMQVGGPVFFLTWDSTRWEA